jgi:protoporphyrinogen oxidase
MPETVIIGAGMTGLAAGIASGFPVYEAEPSPGGICSSYYIRPGSLERLPEAPSDGDAYRFEVGGGHWIFGGDPAVSRLIRSLAPVTSYQRRSSVYLTQQARYIPYPIQNHLGYLEKGVAANALAEMALASDAQPTTMAQWQRHYFGQTLYDLFFAPFHRLYTAGLWEQIAPQDAYKSPVDLANVIRGAFESTTSVGYNTRFVYPTEGLNVLAGRLAERCDVRHGKRVVRIDPLRKEIIFEDGTSASYQTLVSTLPLNVMLQLSGLTVESRPDPFTSVLVLNIGAKKGDRCPDDHWLYLDGSESGFHRVGFYSNVDASFLPASSRIDQGRVSIYVERAYPGGARPGRREIERYSASAAAELQRWGFIDEVEVLDSSWVEVAYTWSWPHSRWKQQALSILAQHDIEQVGRYGRWIFQGIADSIRDGLYVGAAVANSATATREIRKVLETVA